MGKVWCGVEDGREWGIGMSDDCQVKEMKRRRIGN